LNTKIMRVNKSCPYFPCHSGLEDCAFCYCPFYPCGNKRLGKYIITKERIKVWSCKDCSWIHKKKVVDKIFHLIRWQFIQAPDRGQKFKLKDTGIIILGHGSKLKKANDTIREVIRTIKRKVSCPVIEPAYLQLFKPELRTSVKKVIAKGCKRVVIVPFFLFMGNHVARDIPKAIEEEKRIYRDVEFIYAQNLGQDSRISDIVLDCIRKAI